MTFRHAVACAVSFFATIGAAAVLWAGITLMLVVTP